MSAIEQYPAIFDLIEPGRGKFTLINFSDHCDELGDFNKDGIRLVVSKEYRLLADWPEKSDSGFVLVLNVKGRKRAKDFEFQVGSEVVNPMATDAKGSYLLKIRSADGKKEYSFSVDVRKAPTPGFARGRQDAFVPREKIVINQSDEQASSKPNSKASGPDSLSGVTSGPAQDFSKSPGHVQGLGTDPRTLQEGATATPFSKDQVSDPNFNQSANFASATNSNFSSANQTTSPNKSSTSSSQAIVKIVGIVCVLILLVGAVFFVMNLMKGSVSSEPQSNVNQSCSLDKATGDDKDIINKCLASNPSNEDINNLLADAFKKERCEIVLRVLRTKGREPNGGIYAYVYSKYADPMSSYNSKCISKSVDDASYWLDRAKGDQSFDQVKADQLLKSWQ